MPKQMSKLISLSLLFTLIIMPLQASDDMQAINAKRRVNKVKFENCLKNKCSIEIRNCRKNYAQMGMECLKYYTNIRGAKKCLKQFCVDLGVNCQKWCIEDFQEEQARLNAQENEARANKEVTPGEVVETCEVDCFERVAHCIGEGRLSRELCHTKKNSCLSLCHMY